MAKEKIVDRVTRLERLAALALAVGGADPRQRREGRDPTIGELADDPETLRRALMRLLPPMQPGETRSSEFSERFDAKWREDILARLELLAKRSEANEHQLDHVRKRGEAVSKNTTDWLAALSLGLDTDDLKLPRFLPVRAYLSEGAPRDPEALSKSVEALLEMLGFGVADEFPVQHGSWFKRWTAKSKDLLTKPEVVERIEKVERAIQLRGLDLPQAESDEKYINGIATFLQSVENIDNAALQVGPMLAVKSTDDGTTSVQVIKLSQDQLIALEKNRSWLSSPRDLLIKIQMACHGIGASYARASVPDISDIEKETKKRGDESRSQLPKPPKP